LYQQKQAGTLTLNLGYPFTLDAETASLQCCKGIKLYTQMAGLQKHQKGSLTKMPRSLSEIHLITL